MARLSALAGATAGGLALPQPAPAAVSAVDRKLIILFALGGWDMTRVFAAEFDNRDVAMENNADTLNVHGLEVGLLTAAAHSSEQASATSSPLSGSSSQYSPKPPAQTSLLP